MVMLLVGVADGCVTFGAPRFASCARKPPAAVASATRDQLPDIATSSAAA